jgi:hypothetical protein
VTTFSAHNPVRGGITVLQSQDWFEGQALRGLIKGRAEQKKGRKEHWGKDQRAEKSTQKNRVEKKGQRKQSTNPNTERKREQEGRTQ